MKCEYEIALEYVDNMHLVKIICTKPNGCPCQHKSKPRSVFG